MKKLVILDYTTATVHFYIIPESTLVDEYYISTLGHNSNNVHWMEGNLAVIKHKQR